MFVQVTQHGRATYWYSESRPAIGRVFEVDEPMLIGANYFLVTGEYNDRQFSELRGKKYTNGSSPNGGTYSGCWIDYEDCIEFVDDTVTNQTAAKILDKEW